MHASHSLNLHIGDKEIEPVMFQSQICCSKLWAIPHQTVCPISNERIRLKWACLQFLNINWSCEGSLRCQLAHCSDCIWFKDRMQFITFTSQFGVKTRRYFHHPSFPFPLHPESSVCPFYPHLGGEETTVTFIFLLLTIVFIGLETRQREKPWLTCYTVRAC